MRNFDELNENEKAVINWYKEAIEDYALIDYDIIDFETKRKRAKRFYRSIRLFHHIWDNSRHCYVFRFEPKINKALDSLVNDGWLQHWNSAVDTSFNLRKDAFEIIWKQIEKEHKQND